MRKIYFEWIIWEEIFLQLQDTFESVEYIPCDVSLHDWVKYYEEVVIDLDDIYYDRYKVLPEICFIEDILMQWYSLDYDRKNKRFIFN